MISSNMTPVQKKTCQESIQYVTRVRKGTNTAASP